MSHDETNRARWESYHHRTGVDLTCGLTSVLADIAGQDACSSNFAKLIKAALPSSGDPRNGSRGLTRHDLDDQAILAHGMVRLSFVNLVILAAD